jgi:hypothetical protein
MADLVAGVSKERLQLFRGPVVGVMVVEVMVAAAIVTEIIGLTGA